MDQSVVDVIRRRFNCEAEYKVLSDLTSVVLAPDGKKFFVNPHASLYELVYSIGEILAHRKLEVLGFDNLTLNCSTIERETLSLLLPDNEFAPHSNKPLSDLFVLFSFCSLETLAKRILDFQQRILTIWNNYEIILRRAARGMEFSKNPLPFETECMQYAYKTKSCIIRKHENQGIRCDSFFQAEKEKRINKIIMLTQFPEAEI